MNLYNLDNSRYFYSVEDAVRRPTSKCFILISDCSASNSLKQIGKVTCYWNEVKKCRLFKRGQKTKRYYIKKGFK